MLWTRKLQHIHFLLYSMFTEIIERAPGTVTVHGALVKSVQMQSENGSTIQNGKHNFICKTISLLNRTFKYLIKFTHAAVGCPLDTHGDFHFPKTTYSQVSAFLQWIVSPRHCTLVDFLSLAAFTIASFISESFSLPLYVSSNFPSKDVNLYLYMNFFFETMSVVNNAI